jgi:hypothetical protein
MAELESRDVLSFSGATRVMGDRTEGSAHGAAAPEVDPSLLGSVKHAFTGRWADRAGNPDVFACDESASRNALSAMDRFVTELFAELFAEPAT